MVHGEQQPNQSNSSFENVTGSENGREPAQAVVTTVGPTASAQEAKERVAERIEREMEIFRKGECS